MHAQRKLSFVELGRGLAATAVVSYHVSRHLNTAIGAPALLRVFQFGHAGVDLFFVISGFIILFVHYGDIDAPTRFRPYIARRFSRVMPLYWIALGLTVITRLGGGRGPSAGELLWSASLLSPEPLLGVAWTLHFEVTFYAAFSVLVLHRRAGVGVLLAWLSWIAFALMHGGTGLPGNLHQLYSLEFFVGMAAAYFLRRRLVWRPRLVLAAGLMLFALAALAEDAGVLDGYADWARVAYGLPSALIVLGGVDAERRGLLAMPNGLPALLGNASYSTYLFQSFFVGATWKVWVGTGMVLSAPLWASFLALTSAALVGGVLTWRLVEKPLLRLVQSRTVKAAGHPTASLALLRIP